MLKPLQFVISFFERKPLGNDRFHLGNHVSSLAGIPQFRHKTAQLVSLIPAVFSQLLYSSPLSQNAPLLGDRNPKALTQRLKIMELVCRKRMTRQDPVILQRIDQSLVDFAIRAFSFEDIDLPLYQKNQQQQVNLIGHEAVNGGAQMVIDTRGTGMMLE